jgi:hypothetical protein
LCLIPLLIVFLEFFLISSFFIIHSIFLDSSVDGANEVELECDYNSDRCEVESVDLSWKSIGTKFTFPGTQQQKQRITEFSIKDSGRVDFLPQNLIQELPKIKDLTIDHSDISILRSNFFKPEFSKIQGLWLSSNKIKIIEENAFAHLSNLDSIGLYGNELKMLSGKLFQNNHKLMRIYLEQNKIKIIDPGTFRSLNQLAHIYFLQNECINRYRT